MRVIPKTHTVAVIWEEYATALLKKNPEWWSTRISGSYRKKDVIWARKQHRDGMVVVEVISYVKFRKIIEQFLELARKEIIAGNSVRIPHCGRIAAKRIERDFRKGAKKAINWGKTLSRPPVWNEERQKFIRKKFYYTDDFFCRIAWSRPAVRNDSVYQFKPCQDSSKGVLGFMGEFAKALTDNPFLRYKYWFEPMKDYGKKRKLKTNGIQIDRD